MNKTELRIKYKALRANLSKLEIDDLSIAIANNARTCNIWNHEYYHVFLPIVTQNEVNTAFILKILQNKNKKIVLSKSDFSNQEMQHFLLNDFTKIELNHLNIPEPINGISVNNDKIDVVFVPLLAYDNLGNRVGYGKGFYDKFLSNCQPETIKIGLSFFNPENLIDGININDVKLDYCITPYLIYKF